MKRVAITLGVSAIITTVAVSGALAFGCSADNGVQIGWSASRKDTPGERKWVRETAITQCEETKSNSNHPGGRCVIRGCSSDVNTADEAKGKWPM
jgi:hypothetical protein